MSTEAVLSLVSLCSAAGRHTRLLIFVISFGGDQEDFKISSPLLPSASKTIFIALNHPSSVNYCAYLLVAAITTENIAIPA